jgi:hypothetical protein
MQRIATTENPPLRQRGSGIRFPTLSQEDVLHIGKYAQAMFGSGKKIEDVNTFSTFDTFDIGFCGWSAPLRAPYAYAVHLDRALIPITWSLMDPRVK